MQIDSHQHFWKFTADEFPWIKPDWPIRQDYLPADLAPLLQHHGITRSVAVQARQSLEETRWLLQLAEAHSWIAGVIGWVDLCSDHVEESLDEFKSHRKFVGVRHVVQDEPDDAFMLRSDFRRGIAALRSFGLTYDILIFPCQLSAAIDLVSQFPEQKFVVDHLAKPPIAATIFSPWREQIEELAKLPNVFCKLSGFMTEADWQSWREADFNPYFDVALAAFGAKRLMFGSDWPVALLAGSYDQACSIVNHYIDKLSAPERVGIMGLNAAGVYNLLHN
jgi:L-fuconolactonase